VFDVTTRESSTTQPCRQDGLSFFAQWWNAFSIERQKQLQLD